MCQKPGRQGEPRVFIEEGDAWKTIASEAIIVARACFGYFGSEG